MEQEPTPAYKNKISKKWQDYWAENKVDQATDFDDRPKKYILDMFPYPSGAGLHVGHPEGYTATDIYSRYLRMNGCNVLHPMGWDAFGLPAENYAIKTGTHPKKTTEDNIKVFKNQIQSIGFSYDWDREIDTTNKEYYKWTQWIFIKLFEHGLAYENEAPINFCPSCKTGLANEEVVSGECERCGAKVEKKNLKQWVLRITKYADRLLEDLDKLDWPEPIKAMQRNWIGKSYGTNVIFKLNIGEDLSVFTTRADTLFGCTYVVVAPEHQIIQRFASKIKNYKQVSKYINSVKDKSDLERTELTKEKSGIILDGIFATNPINNKQVPIYVADYVLGHYGTGAVMAVPAHDERDFEFAKKYDLEIIWVIGPTDEKDNVFTEYGILENSKEFSGLSSKEAIKEITKKLSEKKLGSEAINYKLRDWIFSRQRYWGEPIPIIHCQKCGQVPVPESDLPVELPAVDNYEPSGDGTSPLSKIESWVNTKCPKCGGAARRESNTMPQWAGSCWYYLRFIDPKNDKALADQKKLKYWLPVDLYVGGAEHAVLHLLYARFWHKFLFDIGIVPNDEPFMKLRNQGMILAEDGRKMSKSLGNVINPDDVINKYGPDVFRMFEMFIGPFEDAKPWSTTSINGINRFLWKRVCMISNKLINGALSGKYQIENNHSDSIHKTIKKVSEDIENFKFNTAIAEFMIFFNGKDGKPDWKPKIENNPKDNIVDFSALKNFLIVLSPFAPHICEEIYQKLMTKLGEKTNLGEKYDSIFREKWPKYDKNRIVNEQVELVIQINSKIRAKTTIRRGSSREETTKYALSEPRISKLLSSGKIKKTIIVEDRLINFIV